MHKPFDATLNALIDLRPGEWAAAFARILGIPAGPCEALDTDLATTLQADKAFLLKGPQPTILHLEFESSPRLGIPRELLRYNTLVDLQHDMPVESVLVLLRPKAQSSDQTGIYERFGVGNNRITEFRYRVERVWLRPVDYWLNSGLGLAPLALLTDEADSNIESALGRFRERVRDEKSDPVVEEKVFGSSYVLCGLRYHTARIVDLYRSMSMLMEESATYQDILQQGVSQGSIRSLRDTVLRQGTKRFGGPDAENRAILDRADSDQLQLLTDRIFDVKSWQELLEGI